MGRYRQKPEKLEGRTRPRAGARSTGVTDPTLGDAARKPRARTARVPGAGQDLHLERLQVVEALLGIAGA